jgi:hypothetical protein
MFSPSESRRPLGLCELDISECRALGTSQNEEIKGPDCTENLSAEMGRLQRAFWTYLGQDSILSLDPPSIAF